MRSDVRLAVVLLAVCVAAGLLAACGGSVSRGSTTDPGATRSDSVPPPPAPDGPDRQAGKQPNIVVFQTDDQPLSEANARSMPKVTKLLAREGTRFPHAYLTTPDCCPSRASLITGQYGHNNGVLHNDYSLLQHKTNVLPKWLSRAGYVTAHIGKYLNGYHHLDPAPGWTQWHSMLKNGRYYDFDLSNNGRPVHYGEKPRDYVTRVFSRMAVRMIHRYVPRRRPLYLQVDEVAPHPARGGRGVTSKCSPVPDPRDEGKFKDTPLPRPPSFDEPDMSDKPAFMQDIPRISRSDLHRMKRNYRCGLASLKAVDRSFGRVYNELKRLGELNNTVFISYTDNGIFFGEHRLPFGKLNPYNEALSTPLLMRVPRRYLGGKQAVRRVTAPVANIDFAPTILRLAHAKPCKKPGVCRIMDGRSLLPLIAGRDPSWAADRPIGIELATEHGSSKHLAACEYSGVRVGDETLVKYRRVQKLGSDDCVSVDEFERYDLAKDPYQLRSLCPGGDPGSCPDDSEQQHLRKLVKKIHHCTGIAGRDPRTGDRPYCD